MPDTQPHDRRLRYATLAAITVATIAIAVAVIAESGGGPSPAAAAPVAAPSASTVSVSGTGSVEGVPDTLVATLHVHARDASVQSALDASAADTRKVLASLQHSGVAAKDVRTTDVELDPDYGSHDTITGYDSSESLSVRIHPLSHVGRILAAAATAAGNSTSIDGLSYDIADNSGLLTAARASAFASAKSQAQQYAQLSGHTLGSVASVSAVVSNSEQPTYDKVAYAASAAAGTASVPIQAGQQKVAVTVKVVWTLASAG